MKSRRRFASRLIRLAARLVGDRRGGTAIEYGLIAGLVVITMIVALINLANTTVGMWNNINANVAAVTH